MTASTVPLFPLGHVVATPGALDAVAGHPGLLHRLVARHVHGDWGDLDAEDRQANDVALRVGSRIFSAYTTANGVKLWIITEADRASTCVLLPDEY
jgi:hypothetical protein